VRSSLARESREDRAARRVSLRPASVCRASVCRERDDCEAPRPVLELARESRHPASATPRTTVSARRTRSRRDMGLVSGSGADCPLSIHMGVLHQCEWSSKSRSAPKCPFSRPVLSARGQRGCQAVIAATSGGRLPTAVRVAIGPVLVPPNGMFARAARSS